MVAQFGTSGLRGLAQELIGEPSLRYVSAFAQHLFGLGLAKKGGRVCVGWDFRASSPAIVENVKTALARAGLQPVLCGTLPTQAIALWAMSQGEASIMVTGSHIPGNRNGLKFYLPTGEISKLDEAAISRIAQKSLANLRSIEQSSDCVAPNEAEHAAACFKARYIDAFQHHRLDGLKIGVYEHSSVARDLLKDVLVQLGAKVVALGRALEFTPVDTEAITSETRQKLLAWATEHDLDAIVSTDGDGDRPLIADENGMVIRGDVIGLATAKFFSAQCIATPVTSNSGIERSVNAKVLRTRVGSPYVVEAMLEEAGHRSQSIVGFEANGGFLTQTRVLLGAKQISPLPTRDSFLPILSILASSKAAGASIAEYVAEFRLPFAMSDRIENFNHDRSRTLMEPLRNSRDAMQEFFGERGVIETADQTDGLRVIFASGEVVHFRPSGNAPEFRIYVEAKSEAAAEALMGWSIDAIETAQTEQTRLRMVG